jgi:riboflavin synthase
MFSGIVETIGDVTHITADANCKCFTIQPRNPFSDLIVGESIAINGICLTVTHFIANAFNVTAVPETWRLTNLDQLIVGSEVNLERAMQLTGRLGGHYVQGHIDCKGRLLEITEDKNSHSSHGSLEKTTTNNIALIARISIPEKFAKYIIKKGYIAIDGMSITLIDTAPSWFTVTFVPYTQAVTIAKNYKKDTVVNIEIDMMSKYVEKLLGNTQHDNSYQSS